MSKVFIDRALLERVQERLDPHRDAVLWGAVCDTFHTAPSGTPAMPVKAYYHESPNLDGIRTRSVGLEVRKAFIDAPLVLESDAMECITYLEGEIAKRDEELAACRVAVENCDLFRARIAELEARIVWLECEAQVNAAPVSEAKAQGVVQWPEADEIMQMAFEEGQPADDASGYCFELEEFDLFIERLMSEVARLNAATVQQVSVPDEMRSLAQRLREYNQNPHHINPMSEAFHILVADAANAISTACVPKEIAAAITWSEHLLFECGALTSTRAPSVHVYNKTFAAVNEARAMLAAAPAAPAADAGLVEALDYQVLFDAIAAATSVYANGAVNISVQVFRDALAAHRAKGVV